MRNPLQDQLLKAGLVKKSRVDQVAREQVKQRQGKAPAPSGGESVDAQRLQAERAERDRALAAERNAQARAHEQRAQARQIIDEQKIPFEGEIAYRFTDAGSIRSVPVSAPQRAQLARGTLVLARHGEAYALLPRAAADKVHARDAALIVLDHACGEAATDEDDAYKDFPPVPDDLIW